MQIDPSVSEAFATLRDAFRRDEFTPLPTAANLPYLDWLQRRFLTRVANALPGLASVPNRAAHDIPITPATEPASIATRMIARLTERLHLEAAEVELIRLAVAICQSDTDVGPAHRAGTSPGAVLRRALTAMNWTTEAERNRYLAALLSVPESHISDLFEPPWNLPAMHLLDVTKWQTASGIDSYASVTNEFLAMLDNAYRSDEALLADLAVTPFDALLSMASTESADEFYAWLPSGVLDCYRVGQQERALSAVQLASAVRWWCGVDLPAATYERLADRLQFEQVRTVIAREFIAVRQSGRRPTTRDVVTAIYRAAA